MIYLKTREEIELMRESAMMVSRTIALIAKEVKPGVEPASLDKLAEEFIRDNGGVPAFKGYGHKSNPFPATLCISINEAVVHGIPTKKPLIEGDIISVDCGVKKNGYYGDHAYTFAVGNIKPEIQKLIDVTKESLYLGIEQMVSGNRIGDISYAIQQHAEKNGFGVVRELVGHGLGKNLHEEPEVPNYGKRGDGPKLKEGMVLAIEPMINFGTKNIKQLKDGWTIITADGKPSAHFEHDVAIVDGKPEILSSYAIIEEALASVK
ncbi:MAG: type I methionyl aminopeptidase [Bacteroidia bacterium]|nr:type I methionyl aminopeptidase [Bacteroidia bacterium]